MPAMVVHLSSTKLVLPVTNRSNPSKSPLTQWCLATALCARCSVNTSVSPRCSSATRNLMSSIRP